MPAARMGQESARVDKIAIHVKHRLSDSSTSPVISLVISLVVVTTRPRHVMSIQIRRSTRMSAETNNSGSIVVSQSKLPWSRSRIPCTSRRGSSVPGSSRQMPRIQCNDQIPRYKSARTRDTGRNRHSQRIGRCCRRRPVRRGARESTERTFRIPGHSGETGDGASAASEKGCSPLKDGDKTGSNHLETASLRFLLLHDMDVPEKNSPNHCDTRGTVVISNNKVETRRRWSSSPGVERDGAG